MVSPSKGSAHSVHRPSYAACPIRTRSIIFRALTGPKAAQDGKHLLHWVRGQDYGRFDRNWVSREASTIHVPALRESPKTGCSQWNGASACVHPPVPGPLPSFPPRRGAAVDDLIQDARMFWARVPVEETPPPGSVHSWPLTAADKPGE